MTASERDAQQLWSESVGCTYPTIKHDTDHGQEDRTAANRSSIGIEHCARSPGELNRHRPAGTPPDPGLPVTHEQYAASAKLVAWLCQQFDLPMDRDHTKGHCEAVQTSHEDCLNRIWDWPGYMALVTAS